MYLSISLHVYSATYLAWPSLVQDASAEVCSTLGWKCAGCKGWCVSGAMVKICFAQGLKCACARVEMCPVLGCRRAGC